MDRILRAQAGVVSRRQLEEAGVRPHDLERMLRRRDLVRILPGVFLDHTGRPTWLQRSWAGTLYYGPAALAGDSALRTDLRGPIQIAIDHSRRCCDLPGYQVRRVRRLAERVQPGSSPPRMRVEEAAIDAALARRSDLDAIGVLADICQSRRTTANRLLVTLSDRSRCPRRKWFEGVLTDIADGTCSVLEQGYLDRIERAHALPRGQRQACGRSPALRDVDYDPLALVIELDGRLFHDNASQRDRDLDRDLDAIVDGRVTVRLGWGQVFERPCLTARRISALLVRAGWAGSARPCGTECDI